MAGPSTKTRLSYKIDHGREDDEGNRKVKIIIQRTAIEKFWLLGPYKYDINSFGRAVKNDIRKAGKHTHQAAGLELSDFDLAEVFSAMPRTARPICRVCVYHLLHSAEVTGLPEPAHDYVWKTCSS
jgi:hypothetical protein